MNSFLLISAIVILVYLAIITPVILYTAVMVNRHVKVNTIGLSGLINVLKEDSESMHEKLDIISIASRYDLICVRPYISSLMAAHVKDENFEKAGQCKDLLKKIELFLKDASEADRSRMENNNNNNEDNDNNVD